MLAIGCDDFVAKPCDLERLLEKMAEHLGVRYVYRDRESNSLRSSALSSAQNPLSSLTAEQLQVMPSNWINQLYQACIELSSSKVMRLISQIPLEQQVLAQALTYRVNDFQFEEIMQAAAVARSSGGTNHV